VDIETLWRVTAAIVPVSLGLGYFFSSHNHQLLARLCFLFAGVWSGVIGFMWLVHTPTSLGFRWLAALSGNGKSGPLQPHGD
jgi:hypothetical protein